MVADKIKVENLPSYEIGYEKGIERGIEKGYERGREEWYEKGIEEGMKRVLKEKRAIALSLLEVLDDETISKKVGLPVEEVKKLRNSKNS